MDSIYLDKISDFHNRNIDLGPVQKELLPYFAENPCLSAYEIHSRYKKTKYYKTVNKPVRQLYELGLIEKVQKESIQKESKHKAIPYRLSIGGIYNLIHKQRRLFVKLLKKVLQNYEDNIIFKTLLYPYLEKNTIFQVYDTRLLSIVCGYLYDCCEATEGALDSKNNIAGTHSNEEVFIWKDVPGVDNARLLTFLKLRYDLDWLDKAEIKKFEDGNTIVIRDRAKSLSIVLNDKNTSAQLRINRKKVYEFVVNPLSDGYLSIGAPGETVKETYTKFFEGMVNSLVSNLIVTLALGAIPGLGIGFEALAQDNRFMWLLEETQNKFRKQCDELLAARKSIGVTRSKQKG